MTYPRLAGWWQPLDACSCPPADHAQLDAAGWWRPPAPEVVDARLQCLCGCWWEWHANRQPSPPHSPA